MDGRARLDKNGTHSGPANATWVPSDSIASSRVTPNSNSAAA